MKLFQPPDFSTGDVECRFQDGEVCIYGTPAGLRRFSDLLIKVATEGEIGGSAHLHTEDYALLTCKSERCAVAAFCPSTQARGPTGG